jgi:hypothetical protein
VGTVNELVVAVVNDCITGDFTRIVNDLSAVCDPTDDVARNVNVLEVSDPTAENPLIAPDEVFKDAPVGKLPVATEYVIVPPSGSAAVNDKAVPLAESNTVYVPAAVLHTGSRSTVPAVVNVPLNPEGFTILRSKDAPPT